MSPRLLAGRDQTWLTRATPGHSDSSRAHHHQPLPLILIIILILITTIILLYHHHNLVNNHTWLIISLNSSNLSHSFHPQVSLVMIVTRQDGLGLFFEQGLGLEDIYPLWSALLHCALRACH